MKHLIRLAVPVLLGCLAEIASAQHVTLSQSGAAEINAFLSETVQQGKVPAIVAVVAGRDSVLYHNAFGMRNAGAKIDLEEDDLFDVASMTKPVTAVAVMMLYDEGKLSLDDPISKYFPAFGDLEVMTSFNKEDTTYTSTPPRNPITIRHLLSHTSGMAYPWFHEPLLLLFRKAGGDGVRVRL